MIQFIGSVLLMSLLLPASVHSLLFSTPHQPLVMPPSRAVAGTFGIMTTAPRGIVIDRQSQAVLWEKDADAVAPIASLTKLMTALVVVRSNPNWNQQVTIERADLREGGIVQVFAGETVTVEELFNLMLVASSNESAIALARITHGEQFVEKMNETARELQLEKTIFVDPTGLEPGNVSTAREVARLVQEAFNHEVIRTATHQSTYQTVTPQGRTITALSTDELLGSFVNKDVYTIVGAKTGYLEEAGYCFAAIVKKDTQEIVTVLLGSQTQSDRWQEVKGTVDWVFSVYSWPVL